LITGLITPAGIFKPADLWKNRHRLGYKKRAREAERKKMEKTELALKEKRYRI
jgi:hypothetical protein